MAGKIGILTAGSDCPGLNAAIRAIGKSAQGVYKMGLIGFQDGFEGLIQDKSAPIETSDLSGILTAGGTLLGTSRSELRGLNPDQRVMDLLDRAAKTYKKHKLEALICLGGRDTQESALLLKQHGLNVITLPKAVDNSVAGTDYTVGFDTALSVATEALDRLHSTAYSHHRIIIVELMGISSGWLTLGAGISSGADVILIPEIPYEVEKVTQAILDRNRAGKRFSILAVSEGARSRDQVQFFDRSREVNQRLRDGGDQQQVEALLAEIETRSTRGSTHLLASQLEKTSGLETRITILGYLLRGGAPSATDRIRATQMGTRCVELVNQGCFGVMVAGRAGEAEPVPLEEVAGKTKTIPLDHPWIQSAIQVGVHLGND